MALENVRPPPGRLYCVVVSLNPVNWAMPMAAYAHCSIRRVIHHVCHELGLLRSGGRATLRGLLRYEIRLPFPSTGSVLAPAFFLLL
jgi:hypothetical protein